MNGKRSPENISTKQSKIATLARIDSERALTTLAHHIDLEWLREAYRQTRTNAAPGIDGVTAQQYGENLEENLSKLLDRFKSGRYHAPAVRRVYIEKDGGQSTRALGIPTLEDKVLQRAVLMVLEPIYEQDFLACSYGFRPGRSAHEAVSDLWTGLMNFKGCWVLDLDISKFFDNVERAQLNEMLDQRVRDGVIRRVLAVLVKRLDRFGLSLNMTKTKLIRFAPSTRPKREVKDEGGTKRSATSFDFLGFTHIWQRSRKGRWVVVRRTAKDRFARALRSMWLWCRRNRHRSLEEQQRLINRKLVGHYNYYGIAGNSRSLGRFRHKVECVWCYWLRRRSSKKLTWGRLSRLVVRYPFALARLPCGTYSSG